MNDNQFGPRYRFEKIMPDGNRKPTIKNDDRYLGGKDACKVKLLFGIFSLNSLFVIRKMILINDNTIIVQYCRVIQEGHYGVILELPTKLEEHF